MKDQKILRITKMSDYDKKQILKEMKIKNPDYKNPTYYEDLLKRHQRLSDFIKKNYTQ